MVTESQFLEVLKAVISVPGGVAVLFLAVKWLLKDWFNKNTEIQELKSKLKNQEIDSLKEKIETLERIIVSYNAELTEMNEAIRMTARDIHVSMMKIDDFSKQTDSTFREFARLTHERFKMLEAFNEDLKRKASQTAASRKENLGKDLVMFKDEKKKS